LDVSRRLFLQSVLRPTIFSKSRIVPMEDPSKDRRKSG
jgi:hypothetical protein